MATSIYICEECEAPIVSRVGGKKYSLDARRKHRRTLHDGCKEHPKAGIRLTFTDLAPDRDPEAIAAAKRERTAKRAEPVERPRLLVGGKEVVESRPERAQVAAETAAADAAQAEAEARTAAEAEARAKAEADKKRGTNGD